MAACFAEVDKHLGLTSSFHTLVLLSMLHIQTYTQYADSIKGSCFCEASIGMDQVLSVGCDDPLLFSFTPELPARNATPISNQLYPALST